MSGGFQRVNPIGEGFIRAPARLLVEPITSVFPVHLTDIINLASTGYTTEQQTLTITGTPAGGTFALAFQSVATAPIAYNAAAADVVTALTALPGIGAGGVTATGGPLPGTPVVITFAGSNANLAQPLITVPSTYMALTGGTSPAASVARTVAGFGLYDPVGNWTELGSTKTGAAVAYNNTETMIDVDQILTPILAIPDEWEATVTTSLAETTLENIQLCWEGGAITTDITQSPNERTLPMGAALAYTQRRLAVVAQKTIGPSANRIRAQVFRIVTRSPQASQLTYDKTGPQQTIPMVFRAFADPAIADPKARIGATIEQAFA